MKLEPEAKEFKTWAELQGIKATMDYQKYLYDVTARKERNKYFMKRATYDYLIRMLGRDKNLPWEEQVVKIKDFTKFGPRVLDGEKDALQEIKHKIWEAEIG